MQNLSMARLGAADFVKFLNKAVSPYHAVDECCTLLKEAGFIEIKEGEKWTLQPLHKYYVTRNKSAIIAFAIGGQFKPGNGFAIVAAHTDSPCLKVKPVSKLASANFLQVGVTTYGGGIWRTWFDRDLTVAGRAIIKDVNGVVTDKLVHIKRPIMNIPNLAIHLDRDSNEKFVFNKEEHLRPILATQVFQQLNDSTSSSKTATDMEKSAAEPDHHPVILNALAQEMGTTVDSILDMDLCVIDTQPAVIGGLNDEFIFGARLDNLVSTFAAVKALLNSCQENGGLERDSSVRLVACYDNEECGSESAQGAMSAFSEWVLRRIQRETFGDWPQDESSCAFERAMARSFLISADQGHAQHPNYKAKHEENHTPRFHGGPIIKINANQRYASTIFTQAFLKQAASIAGVPLQKMVVRNDSLCGSTVGPILSAKLGLKTVDIGAPQLAMHSIREMACTSGVDQCRRLFQAFYENFSSLSSAYEGAL